MTLIKKYRIGVHLSISGSILNIFREADYLNINTIACFTGSNLRYSLETNFDSDTLKIFHKKINEKNYKVFSHASYLINIANADKTDTYKKSIEAIKAELTRCSILGIIGAVIHPGSNPNKYEGLKSIAFAINSIFENFNYPAKLLLEASAGQGNTIPVSLEDIDLVYKMLSHTAQEKTRLVIDTCHTHAAGYSLSTKNSVQNFLDEYDKTIGLEKVELIHLNDSKKPCGSKIDRHENIGKGSIGLEGFATFLNDERTKQIPKILETPVTNYMDWKIDLNILENLMS